jgi:putative glutamine amidotransferase
MHRAREDVTVTPVIGITRCSRVEDYMTSVEQAGGAARVLDFNERPADVLAEIDGVLLTGGGDVDPLLYGEARHPTVEEAEPGRDAFEIELARRAMAANLPLLAICRGAQVLNVSSGGTLVQDIPSAIDTELTHSVEQPKDTLAHDIRVAAGSVLEQALGRALSAAHTCRVNSRHHQSVDRLGRALVASATATDGVVEAIEAPATRFCVGVQWHPENFWHTGEFGPLFRAFIAAAAHGRKDTEDNHH